mmetsp:Transcript_33550/g.99890  ORF Transcript_33550/g.99890 Transcript_33550/m.99890 type:complete len:81 (-) Transcript_33550:474-716(-)
MALLAAVRQRRLLLLLLLQHGNMAGTRPLSTVVHHIRKHIVFVAHCFSAFTPTAIFLTECLAPGSDGGFSITTVCDGLAP